MLKRPFSGILNPENREELLKSRFRGEGKKVTDDSRERHFREKSYPQFLSTILSTAEFASVVW
jgi:hypothetical protein